jgi:hypothetical protein
MKDHVIAGRHAAGLAASMKIDAPMLKLSTAQMSAASEQLGPKADVTEAIKAWGQQQA